MQHTKFVGNQTALQCDHQKWSLVENRIKSKAYCKALGFKPSMDIAVDMDNVDKIHAVVETAKKTAVSIEHKGYTLNDVDALRKKLKNMISNLQ